jgi:hypothetical protein
MAQLLGLMLGIMNMPSGIKVTTVPISNDLRIEIFERSAKIPSGTIKINALNILINSTEISMFPETNQLFAQ